MTELFIKFNPNLDEMGTGCAILLNWGKLLQLKVWKGNIEK